MCKINQDKKKNQKNQKGFDFMATETTVNVEDVLITKSEVLSRGFTEAMIIKLLPNPILKPNPRYKNAAPMKLYKLSDVISAQKTEEYKTLYEKWQKKKFSSTKSVNAKKEKLTDYGKLLADNITVIVLPRKEIVQRVCEHKHLVDEYEVRREVMDRWIVNYIRHNLTIYDNDLNLFKGKTGKQEAYKIYKKTCLQKIAEAYPQLLEECEAQIEKI